MTVAADAAYRRRMTRADTLTYVGIACILAAVVGSGIKVFNSEIGPISSWKRQVALALVGVILVVWSPAAAYVSEPRRVAKSISADIETVAGEVQGGTAEYRTSGEGSYLHSLLPVYQRMDQERSTLGEDLYRLLYRKAGLLLASANHNDVRAAWDDVNAELAAAIAWP